ncbi:phenazine biosynthesis protein PhzF [Xylanimonas oleitrophica]|uniref:Phenazine biosynthesis protein PhzF n=1 Tax=Xylanimonas oleitrophica TaxID=2607479 RepID=A0A2W5WL84_9MICO|nr:phenazine biosynthesis protein PhzF [Xylanimonas oleitrophica]
MPFRQVDVFASGPLLGNPLAVVHDADGLTEEQMAAFARWTNLSETTFLLQPTVAGADYRVRIFTPTGELPFAGHPTLGSAHAWLEAGNKPFGAPTSTDVVQECGVGLVTVRQTLVSGGGVRLAFAAPPPTRSGPLTPPQLQRVTAALRVAPDDVVDAEWVSNGPRWVAVRLRDAAAVLALEPDLERFRAPGEEDLEIGVVGPWVDEDPANPGDADVEVRAFLPDREDPVTGSLNAGLGRWLAGSVLPASYVASQGTALRRRGRVHVDLERDGRVWVGGSTLTTVRGSVTL